MTKRKAPELKKKRGRPDKPISLDKIEELAKAGKTDAEIAKEIGIDESTLHRKKIRDPDLCKSLKDWKEEADEKVEASLYQRACGYSHPDIHVSNFQGQITLTPIIKHYAPDPTSMIFWLKNRQPDKWREKSETRTEHILPNGVEITFKSSNASDKD